MEKCKIMSFGEALNDAHRIVLKNDPKSFVIGQGVNNPWFVGKTTVGLMDEFGKNRVMDSPISEAGMTGACIGAAMAGMHPIVFHPRMDFAYLALDQIINHCASWNYMFNGKVHCPIVIREIINRGGEQGAQHSQSPISIYANIPGLTVVMPATPEDAKGLFISAVKSPNPVIFIDDRWLYDFEGPVPEGEFEIPLGKAQVLREGTDVTIIAASYMVHESMKLVDWFLDKHIDPEIINLRTIKPIDYEAIDNSISKTKRVIIAIAEWENSSVCKTIAEHIYKKHFNKLKSPVKIVCLPDCPAPAAQTLEQAYYCDSETIKSEAEKLFNI